VLDVDEVVIGRGVERARSRSTLTLRFDDQHMSTTHARLVRDGDVWLLHDQNSKNGTRKNGELVESTALADGDVLELGGTFFVFRGSTIAGEPLDSTVDDAPPLGVPTQHAGLRHDLHRLAKLAPSAISIVLLGESGTGKEVVARALHRASERSGELVAVNCGALPASLVESELFGSKKGAFSGAISDREGLIRSAHNGTLLLDEIGDLPISSQAAFLRVLQEREVVPVGGTRGVPIDVRVIAATHRELSRLVAAGAFRDDLLARLAGFELRLPALRERAEDLGTLTRSLLARIAPNAGNDVRFTRRAARALHRYAWPKNVRELEKCLEMAVLLAGSDPIDIDHLPAAVLGEPETPEVSHSDISELAVGADLSPADRERREQLVQLLAQHRGNLTAVARDLGKARFQVQRWVKRYALRPDDYRDAKAPPE
jgi:transcriptional regulator with PAS, ATPase and Fis domain